MSAEAAGPSVADVRDATKHARVREGVRRLIRDGLAPGTQIPTERELAAHHGVSRMTVRQALGQLTVEGVLVREQGRGTFVRDPVGPAPHRRRRPADDPATRHRSTIVVAAEEATAPGAAARILALAPQARAYHVRRLHTVEGRPESVEDAWLHPGVLPGLLDHDLTGSIPALVALLHRRPLSRADHTFGAAAATDDDAVLLGIAVGTPVLTVERVSFSGDSPVEHAVTQYRGDGHRLDGLRAVT